MTPMTRLTMQLVCHGRQPKRHQLGLQKPQQAAEDGIRF
jgi:hypothetical protein